jgi:hypothetical protein
MMSGSTDDDIATPSFKLATLPLDDMAAITRALRHPQRRLFPERKNRPENEPHIFTLNPWKMARRRHPLRFANFLVRKKLREV